VVAIGKLHLYSKWGLESARVVHHVDAANAKSCTAQAASSSVNDSFHSCCQRKQWCAVMHLSCIRTVGRATDGRQVAHVIQAFHDGQHPEGARSSDLQAAGVRF